MLNEYGVSVKLKLFLVMKKKILALVFAVLMFFGSTLTTLACESHWIKAYYVNVECGFTALVCGEDWDAVNEMASVWDEILC